MDLNATTAGPPTFPPAATPLFPESDPDAYYVELISAGVAVVVIGAVFAFAFICNDRVTKRIRAKALRKMQSKLLEQYESEVGTGIELTIFSTDSKLQFVLSDLHFRTIMKPRQILRGSIAWRGAPRRGDQGGANSDEFLPSKQQPLSGHAEVASIATTIKKTVLLEQNASLFCSLLCKQVKAAAPNALGISKMTVVNYQRSPNESGNDDDFMEPRRNFWCAYLGVGHHQRTGLEKFEMQTVIAKTMTVDKDLIAFDVARCTFPGLNNTESQSKLDTVLRAWVQLCNAQLDTSGADHSDVDGPHTSSYNTENDGQSGGIGMVYKQSLAALAAPLLHVANGDEVLATAFLWSLTSRHKGLYKDNSSSAEASSTERSSHTTDSSFENLNLVQQMHFTASLLLFWDPALAQRIFVELGVHPSMFMVSWLEAFFVELFPPNDIPSILDYIISVGCYDRRASAYIATAVLISLRPLLMDEAAINQEWQALQFFSKLNSRGVAINVDKVRALAYQICQGTPQSLRPRPSPEDSDLSIGQLVPIIRSFDELRDLGEQHACVLHIVFRDASKGPLLIGQTSQLSRQTLPEQLSHFQVFALDSAEIVRDGVLSAADVTTTNRSMLKKLQEAFASLLVRKCRGIMAYKGRMVLIFVDQSSNDDDNSASSQKRHLAQRVCVLLSRCYFPNACLVQPPRMVLSSEAQQYALAVQERDATSSDVGQFVGGSGRVSMRVSKSESVILESVEMAGVHYMRLGDGEEEEV